MSRSKPKIPPKRFNAMLPETTYDWLRGEADRLGISMSEVIRRILDEIRFKIK